MGVRIYPEKLRYWRHMRGMDRVQLAEATRLSYDSICSYEQGRVSPGQSSFRRLYTALGIGPEDLLLEPGEKVRKPKDTE
jgi:transcriptional regulator with XRE-family HTH domain